MKRIKILCLLLALAVLTALPGCRLAKAEKMTNGAPGEILTEDKLVGVLVTTSYLALSDREGGRIDGVLTADNAFAFPDVDGIALYAVEVESPERTYTTTGADRRICDRTFGVAAKDDNGIRTEESTLVGTIYYLPGENRIFYSNPIYQTEDGSVYVVSGTGVGCGGDITAGMKTETNWKEETTVRREGEEFLYRADITLHYVSRNAPEKIVVLQMGRDGVLLERSEYLPGQTPEELAPHEDAQYLIVETHSHNGAGEAAVSREMIGWEETEFSTLYFAEDGFGRQVYTELVWQKA